MFLAWATSQTQTANSKVGLQTVYMPHFAVQEASGSNVQALGLRWLLSDYERLPLEFGVHAYAGYGEVARASLGFNLAYLFAEQKSHNFKIDLSLSKIDLEDVETNPEEFGPHIGDVSFASWRNEFKPYIEWEWIFSHFGSLSVQTGYRVINGEKSIITSVESTNDPSLNRSVEWDERFFYSASGFDLGIGISIQL